MTKEQCKEVVLKLLKHFDDMEGTTYLYLEAERASFLYDMPEPIQSTVKVWLDEYHEGR